MSWQNISHIYCGLFGEYIIGLTKDGRIVSAFSYGYGESVDTSGWNDIEMLSIYCNMNLDSTLTIAGLKRDGTVVVVCDPDVGQSETSTWADIISVCAGRGFVLGLKADGGIAVAGEGINIYEGFRINDVADWKLK